MRPEMHGGLHSGGRSSKQLSPLSTPQLKSGSDTVPNNGSFTSQTMGKKRDRSDSSTESIKREHDHSARAGDGYSVGFKFDNMKDEIANMAEKACLTSIEAVEKVVNLILLDRAERKIDLASRVLFANIIAGTERQDYLSKFVMLRGVTVLDDWLQEAHKNGNGSGPKESDKATEELLLALLRALDKLPVNLNALQTCNIGKSINHLRAHKNIEIQKKARWLVDTWKKRVDAEMKNNEAKSAGSGQPIFWPGKPGFPEASNAGNRHAGSAKTSTKSPIVQSLGGKVPPGKPGHADSIMKSAPIASGALKLHSFLGTSAGFNAKELVCRQTCGNAEAELPVSAVKEEKSSCSTQSQNNSQSCSTDPAKTMGSLWKEDARSSTVGPSTVNKAPGGSSRHRRSSNSIPGTTINLVNEETTLSKLVSENRALDNSTLQSGLTCERQVGQVDVPIADSGNSHRLVVRLPNPGCSPTRSGSGSSFEDPSITGGRVSSPNLADKNERADHKLKLSDAFCSHVSTDSNAESWRSNFVKGGIVVSDEGDESPGGVDDEHSRIADGSGKVADPTGDVCLLSGIERGDMSTEPKVTISSSSINALIESCAKYSEGSASLLDGDDNGVDLLASVATGDRSKSESALSGSPRKEEPCSGSNESKLVGIPDLDSKKHEQIDESQRRKDIQQAGPSTSSENRNKLPLQEIAISESAELYPVTHPNSIRGSDSCMKSEGNNEENVGRGLSVSGLGDMMGRLKGAGVYHCQDKRKPSGQVSDVNLDYKVTKRNPCVDRSVGVASGKNGERSYEVICNSLADELDSNASKETSEEQIVGDSPSCSTEKAINAASTIDQQHGKGSVNAIDVDRSADDAVASCSDGNHKKFFDESKTKADATGANSLELKDGEVVDKTNLASLVTPSEIDENVRKKDCSKGSTNQELASSNVPIQEAEHSMKPAGNKNSSNVVCGKEETVMSTEARSEALVDEDVMAKLDFDLNEGISGDDEHQCELASSAGPMCLRSGIHFLSLSPLMPPLSGGYSASITVAAPAKRPFIPLENLSKIKDELGWKGSAATSAFRPAEPRKIWEMPPSTSDVPPSDAARKLGRPPLDIDLNVPDERIFEEMASQSSVQTMPPKLGITDHHVSAGAVEGIDLDLNRIGESTENGQFSLRSSHRLERLFLPVRPPSARFPEAEGRDFDLNGPGVDKASAETARKSQVVKSTTSLPVFPPATGLRVNNREIGNSSSWFPPGNSYPAIAIPSFLPDQREKAYPANVAALGVQRVLGSVAGVSSFGGDTYRGPVLLSSAAMPFSPSTAAFPYASFSFGTGFPLASTSFPSGLTSYADSSSVGAPGFPAIPSQLVGPTAAVSSRYPGPYFNSLPEGSNSIVPENTRIWDRQGLDLNCGPGSLDIGVKDEKPATASRQVLAATSQAFSGEQTMAYQTEQVRIYQTSVAGIKRKEPEGGWDTSYKQLSWQ